MFVPWRRTDERHPRNPINSGCRKRDGPQDRSTFPADRPFTRNLTAGRPRAVVQSGHLGRHANSAGSAACGVRNQFSYLARWLPFLQFAGLKRARIPLTPGWLKACLTEGAGRSVAPSRCLNIVTLSGVRAVDSS